MRNVSQVDLIERYVIKTGSTRIYQNTISVDLIARKFISNMKYEFKFTGTMQQRVYYLDLNRLVDSRCCVMMC